MTEANKTKQARMQRVLEVWVDNPTCTDREIAALAGVGERTFSRYKTDAEFMAKYHEMCEKRFKSLEGKAIEKLKEHIDGGLWQAVKYVLDSSGYKPTEKVDANVNGTQDVNITIGE